MPTQRSRFDTWVPSSGWQAMDHYSGRKLATDIPKEEKVHLVSLIRLIKKDLREISSEDIDMVHLHVQRQTIYILLQPETAKVHLYTRCVLRKLLQQKQR